MIKQLKKILIIINMFILCIFTSCEKSTEDKDINTYQKKPAVYTYDENEGVIEVSDDKKEDIKYAKLVFCGDAMAHVPQSLDAYDKETETYNFDSTFSYIKNDITTADYAQVNFETVLQGKEPKGFPRFSAPDEFAFALKIAGFDLLTTANNHSLDGGMDGIIRTKQVFENLQVDTLGTYNTEEEYSEKNGVLIKDINGIKFAFLALTKSTNGFLLPSNNKYAVDVYTNDYKTKQVDINYEKIDSEINYAKSFNPDIIVALMHWGIEYYKTPDNQQTKLAEYLKNNGVKIIIGSHPHVIQKFEITKREDVNDKTMYDDLVVYSMGNFTSCQMDDYTNVSGMVFVNVAKDNDDVYIDDFYYKPTTFVMRDRKKTPRFFVIDSHYFLNNLVNRNDTKLLNMTTSKMVDAIKDSINKCHEIWDEEFDYYVKNKKIYYDEENIKYANIKDIFVNTKQVEATEPTKVNWTN